MTDNSDYTKPRIDLFELLPDVHRSDVNKSVFANLFNRYLTKQETRKVAGYIGEGNPNAIQKRQIEEFNVHRQGYQLQPILYTKIGSVEWMSSWMDLLNESERLGVDPERLQEWLNLLKFNWVPPVDLDKVIHYRNYYWYDEDNPNSRPQYITIRSRCATATAFANFQQDLVDEFGLTIPTARAELADGSITEFDKLVIQGEFIRLFDPGFVFFYKNSTNTELNVSFWEVVESEYDENENETIIKINTTFSNSVVDGVISLEERLNAALADRDCQCTGAVGWDLLQWDDNPDDPLWEGDHTTFIAGITNAVPPVAPGVEGQLWYDQTNDRLYQYSSETDWKVIWNNFSTLLADTAGQAFWDFTPGCGVNSVVSAADQWIDQNKWLHQSDVPNFSTAKQAQVPIIEYDWDLELNEWTYTEYNWKYRPDNFSPFESVDTKPSLIELVPIEEWTRDSSTDEIILDEQYGDLTDFFVPGSEFMGIGVPDIFEVEYSLYKADNVGEPYRTRVKMTDPVLTSGLVPAITGSPSAVSTTPLRPIVTSQGDSWKGYDIHWLFDGQENTLPVVHQPENPLALIDTGASVTTHTSGNYTFTFTYYAQEATMEVSGVTDIELSSVLLNGTDISLRERALIGFNDTRVFVNGIRQYGTFDEVDDDGFGFVTGISFLPGFELDKFDVVRIGVGEATPLDYGRSSVPVRTIEDNLQFATTGLQTVSLVRYRKAEQVKTETNQYPLFDIYNVDGTPAYKANPVFGYQVDPDAAVNLAVNLRLATDTDDLDYLFQQFIVDSDGTMYAFRDYANRANEYWIRPEEQKVLFWDGLAWAENTMMGNHYMGAIVGDLEPEAPFDFDGLVWYDTLNNELNIRNASSWDTLDATVASEDPTLQTIWRKGLNDELYIPEKRDWQKRSLTEYNEQKELFVEETSQELENTGLTSSEADSQAEDQWFDEQSNHLSTNGNWIGDWEIPDPLYFNHSHENRRVVSFRELLTHFDTIIQAQPKIPGFNGPRESMFHLIPSNEVNYGLGGKIKEFNHGFDTFLSSLFINVVSPRALYDFAQSQYEVLLNSLKEDYRSDANELFINTSTDSLVDFSGFISDSVITSHEQNDRFARLYGDSTTFTDVSGPNDLGVRNWIATLPYFNLVRKRVPVEVVDPDHQVNQIIHHDGHRSNYFLTRATIEGIIQNVVRTDDERTRFPGPTDPPQDTFGRSSTSSPPNDTTEFSTQFNTTILNRTGVFWYHIDGTNRTLYRLSVAAIGTSEPSPSLPDGTLWLDLETGLEVLRIKETNPITSVVSWVPVEGLSPGTSPIRLHNGTNPSDVTTATVSAWKVVDMDEILRKIIFEVENRLYENAPDPFELEYDFAQLESQYPVLYQQLLEQAFLLYTNQSEIIAPFVNDDYSSVDPFTWNYRFSSPGTSYQIVDTDTVTDAFVVEGDVTTGVTSGTSFYVKNSGSNDGLWIVDTTTFDGTFTTITVQSGDVEDNNLGVIYTGLLPSPKDSIPTNLNDGSESGGDWRDLYQKLYRTPFPHLEPWRLQGYDDKPDWWDEEYLNDDPDKWGDRRWKYKHGFEVVGADAAGDYFEIEGDFTDLFVPAFQFSIDKSPSVHDGLWQVDTSTYDPITNLTTVQIDTGVVGPRNDVTTNIVSGRILVRYGMWENIRTGIIPPGRTYPNGIVSVTGKPSTETNLPVDPLPTFNYFSVNIDNQTITTGGTFQPDDVFPPYWDFIPYFGTSLPPTFDRQIRSVYTLFGEIVSPGANYSFGDAGPVEWEWRNSSQFLYDQLTIAFQLDPVRFTYDTFGPDFYTVGGLLINKRTHKVLSHRDTIFHGDILDESAIRFNGTNQWYVNFARFVGLDISMSDFRNQWTQWTAPLMYQFSSFVDTPSLELSHRNVCVSNFDWNVAAKRSPGVEDYWLDSLEVVTLHVPPRINRYDNDYDWQFEVRTKSPVGKPIQYYGVRNYQFYADPTTDICTLYTWKLTSVDQFNNTFSVRGDQTEIFAAGRSFDITGTLDNDGTYTTTVSTFDPIANETIIDTDEDVAGISFDGLLTADYRKIPWQTGDRVVLSTRETLPVPLQGDNINGVYEYFVIIIDDTHFQLATSPSEAQIGNFADITSTGRGDHFVGQLANTFGTSRTTKNWRHYTIDTETTFEFTPPYDVNGIQSIIDIVDGYESFSGEQGWVINSDFSLRDFDDTSRFVSWQVELERFIDFTEGLRYQKYKVNDKYQATVDVVTDEWTFTGPGTPQFVTGDPVGVFVSDNLYPSPLARGIRYYMIRDTLTEFRLAATKADAESGVAIDITSIAGVGDIFIAEAANLRKERPVFEINPFRHGIWFRPERGIVSNLVEGPVEDVFNTQLMLDQYSRSLGRDAMRILREDKETTIRVIEGMSNDVRLSSVFPSPYNYIHLAAIHLFVDTYEHVLIFNNETTEGQLLYDPFVGLNVTKFEMLFNRQIEFTQRPNVGGQYLQTFFNQGADLKRNFEASVEDLRNMYDTYRTLESNTLTEGARDSIGYTGSKVFLDNINLNDKSQFVFWRGQIQSKGSINAVNAFTNSRRFIDARVDEFWAVKVAEFGSTGEKEYISMWISTSDARTNDWRLQFVTDEDLCKVGYDTNVYDSTCGYAFPNEGDSLFVSDPTFLPISLTDTNRWYEQPDQLEKLRDNGGSLYFDLKTTSMIPVTIGVEPTNPNNNDGWIDNTGSTKVFRRWNSDTGTWEDHGEWNVGSPSELPILRHDTESDFITITLDWYDEGHVWCNKQVEGSPPKEVCTPIAGVGSPPAVIKEITIDPFIPLANSIVVFNDGVQLTNAVDYIEVLESGMLLANKLQFVESVAGSEIEVVYKTSSLLEGVHFERVTSNIVRLLFQELAQGMGSPSSLSNFKIWGWNVDKESQNPAKIIDTESEVVITPVQIWDPARGFHYHNGIHVVDLQREEDPAIYTNTPRTGQAPPPHDDFNLVYNDPWNHQEVGTTWLDTTNLEYVPYYDTKVTNDIEERSRLWGSLADWGEIKIYTWVESDVPPSEWDALAETEEGDTSIPQDERKSGRVKQTLFEKDTLGGWVVLENKIDQFDVLIEGLGEGTNTFTLSAVTPRNVDVVSISSDGSVVISGDYSRRIGVGSEFEVAGTASSDGVYTVSDVTSDDTTTTLSVVGSPTGLADEGAVGTVSFYEPVNVYVNGQLVEEDVLVPTTGEVTIVELRNVDRVQVIQLVPTDEVFIEAEIEAGNILREVEYTTDTIFDRLGLERTRYYFWVENKTTRGNRIISPNEAQESLIQIPIPYMFFQGVRPPVRVTFGGVTADLPVRFVQAILRGLRGIINDDLRYIVRWTRDFTLRDSLEHGKTALEKKNLHEQWELIRRDQLSHIPRWLWDKVTESIVGFKLNDPTERVPSFEREFYDTENGTDTRIGIGDGQAFTGGQLALQTILADLNNPNNNFSPVDINVFFQNHNFDTPEDIIDSMNTIYNTFPYNHVNRMFFDTLLDGLSLKGKYADIFKTSMIALHGIRPFQTGGIFDD